MRSFKLTVFLLISILLIGCGNDKKREGANSSDFISDVDDWTIKGDASGERGIIPNFSKKNGLKGSGYIYAVDDAIGGTWYFVAPSKYHGDKSKFFNGKLKFYLIQDSDMSDQFYNKDVIITSKSGKVIEYEFESYPKKTWTKYSINLNNDSHWRDANGYTVSNEEIKYVLSNISDISIRGEFENGPDTGGLDGFKFLKK